KWLPKESKRPIIFFTTGFQLVHLLDSTPNLRLPCQLFVLETGGTKGRSRSVSKTELYTLLSEQWGLSMRQILSEYGMAELACQAYYSDPNRQYFKFADHVRVSVQTGMNQFEREGVGNLTVF